MLVTTCIAAIKWSSTDRMPIITSMRTAPGTLDTGTIMDGRHAAVTMTTAGITATMTMTIGATAGRMVIGNMAAGTTNGQHKYFVNAAGAWNLGRFRRRLAL